MGIKISLDGGATFAEAKEGVRVIYEGMMIPGEDGRGELHVNLTHEGVIMDVWTDGECDGPGSTPSDYNIGTGSEMLVDIISRLVEANS